MNSKSSSNLAARLLDTALASGWGGRIAIREGDSAWTFAELADRVARLSSALGTIRVMPGDRVAVFMRDSLDCAAAILGTIHSGAVAVPVSELARPMDVRNCLNDCGAAAAIVHGSLEPVIDEIRAQIPTLREILCTDVQSPGEREFHTMVRGAAPAPSAAPVESSDPAMILYSAGGADVKLRGVPHRHDTPMAASRSFGCGVVGLDPSDRVLSVVRLSTAYGLGCGLLFPLAAGAEATLLPQQPRSEALFEVLEAVEPTVLFATPSVYSQLARDASAEQRVRPLKGIRVCVSGAEGMPTKLVPKIRDTLGVEVTVGYGLTEAFQFVLAGSCSSGRPGACGRPVPGFQARIIDEDGHPVGPDVIGTLEIQGPTVLSSYWGEEDEDDANRFRDGWFVTRDRFMMDEQGHYYHCGRVDELFKVGGKWVSPSEVERALLAHESVWECAVIGAEDEDGLVKPLAFIVPNIGHEPGDELATLLRSYVKEELAPYKYPRWIDFVEELPKGPTGKVLRYKLPAPTPRRAETVDDSQND